MSESETLRIQTAVLSDYMRDTLFRGVAFAAVGVILLVVCGTYMPPRVMNIWGLPALFAGIGLITWGMLPYRKVKRLEAFPDTLIVIDDQYFQYLSGGRRLLTIPIESVESIGHIEKGRDYGIALWLKEPLPEKITLHSSRVNLPRILARSQERYGCDLLLPFFSKRGYSHLAYLELPRH